MISELIDRGETRNTVFKNTICGSKLLSSAVSIFVRLRFITFSVSSYGWGIKVIKSGPSQNADATRFVP